MNAEHNTMSFEEVYARLRKELWIMPRPEARKLLARHGFHRIGSRYSRAELEKLIKTEKARRRSSPKSAAQISAELNARIASMKGPAGSDEPQLG